MRDTDLYGRILGIERPWRVTDVELRLEAGEVEVFVARGAGDGFSFPECGKEARRHDARRRRWRHLPTCQYRTILTAEVPRCAAGITACGRLACRGSIPVPGSRRCSRSC
ncbi:MAG: transposase family protein [Acidobacteria bacterium]|nr:transposase family protein [Acidobacteriota bacterium]